MSETDCSYDIDKQVCLFNGWSFSFALLIQFVVTSVTPKQVGYEFTFSLSECMCYYFFALNSLS